MRGLGFSTIMGCLSQGESLMNVHPGNWTSNDPAANLFIQRQEGWRAGLAAFGEELRSFATLYPNEVTQKASEWGMRLAMPPTFPAGSVYMISQLKELIEWLYEGSQVYSRPWPEFKLDKAVAGYYIHRFSSEPVIAFNTKKAGDTVFMTRWSQPLDGFGLLKQIEEIEAAMVQSGDRWEQPYSGVNIPCIKAEVEPDLGWLLSLVNRDWFVAYAKQRIEFGMNRLGFAQREETVMVTMRGMVSRPKQPYVLSPNGESFLFWRRRSGVAFPVSMYQFDRADFNDPGDLKNIVA